jgi:hypothetical protein
MTRKRLVTLLGTVVIGVVLSVYCYQQIPPLCGNKIITEVPSPDGKLKAVSFVRDCGATTGFSTQVSIIPADSYLPNEAGNAFTSDGNHGAAASGSAGGPPVGLSWASSQELFIAHHPGARVFRAESRVSGVAVQIVPSNTAP